MNNEQIKKLAIECGIRIDNVLNHVEPKQLQAFAKALLAIEQAKIYELEARLHEVATDWQVNQTQLTTLALENEKLREALEDLRDGKGLLIPIEQLLALTKEGD